MPSPSPLEKTYADMPLVVSWDSRSSTGSQILGSIPDDGHGLMAFTRCEGGGQMTAGIEGKYFSIRMEPPCDGTWRRTDGFPGIGAGEGGPFPVSIRLTGTVTAWEVQVRMFENVRHDE